MTQTKTCHRIVLISGSAPATRHVQDREHVPEHRTTGQRIIIIRNGEFVSRKRKRRARKPDGQAKSPGQGIRDVAQGFRELKAGEGYCSGSPRCVPTRSTYPQR
jgi:hypothetical protein